MSTQPGRSLALGHFAWCSTLVGGLWTMYPPDFNRSLNGGGVSIGEQAWLHNLIVNYIVLHIIYDTLPYKSLPTLSTM